MSQERSVEETNDVVIFESLGDEQRLLSFGNDWLTLIGGHGTRVIEPEELARLESTAHVIKIRITHAEMEIHLKAQKAPGDN